MKYVVSFNNEVLGSVITNHSMTDEEICEMAGVKIAVTQADFENEDGYSIDDLEIVVA